MKFMYRPTPLSLPRSPISPRFAVFLVAILEFVCTLDFMTALPLAPDLAAALGFPPDRIGWLTAAYTLASMAAGLLSLPLLDRYDRRSVFLMALAGLGLATLATTQASGLWSLLAARALTGFFCAPALAVGMAIVIDATPPQARGRAIARVMIGFSAAVIAGVPLSLELARVGNWQTPFLCVAGLSLLLWIAAYIRLPALRAHMGHAAPISLRTLLARPMIRTACALQANSQFAAFLIVPSFSAFFLLNLGYPRAELGGLYLVGGLCAFVLVQLSGRMIDRHGPLLVASIATVSFMIGLTPLLGMQVVPLMLFFVLFMCGNAVRNIGLATVISQLPDPHERAGFMALQNVVQDLAISVAAIVASLALTTDANGRLAGMQPLVVVSAMSAIAVMALLYRLLRIRAVSATALAVD